MKEETEPRESVGKNMFFFLSSQHAASHMDPLFLKDTYPTVYLCSGLYLQ